MSDCVYNRRVHVQIRIFGCIVQSVVDDTGYVVHVLGIDGFLLCDRRDNYHVRDGQILFLADLRQALAVGCIIELVFKVAEHLVDDRIRRIAEIKFICIREQVSLQPIGLIAQIVRQEIVVKRIVLQCRLKLLLGAESVFNQCINNFVDGIAFRNGDSHRALTGQTNLVNNGAVVHVGVERPHTRTELNVFINCAGKQMEQRAVMNHAAFIQQLGYLAHRCILRNGNCDVFVRLCKGKEVIAQQNAASCQHGRNDQNHHQILDGTADTLFLFFVRFHISILSDVILGQFE